MKKLLLIITTAFGLMAQGGEYLDFSEFRIAGLNPESADAGLYISVSTGKMFDPNLAYQFEIGYYSETYRKQQRVYDEGQQATVVSTLFEESTTYIPLLAKFNFVRGLDMQDEANSTFLLKADLGIGFGFLWNSEQNFQPGLKNDDSRFFSGFIWQAGADIGMQISTTGSIYAGLFYNGGSPTGDHREVNGLPTFTEKDMSGLGYRLTIRLDGIGLF